MTKTHEPKIAEVIAAIAAEVKMTEVEIRAVIKERKIRSFKKVAEFVAEWKAAQPVETPKVRATRNTRTVRTPRKVQGFTFGAVWNASVIAGEGVALHPLNAKKLLAQATVYGIDARFYEPAELAEKIAERLQLAA